MMKNHTNMFKHPRCGLETPRYMILNPTCDYKLKKHKISIKVNVNAQKQNVFPEGQGSTCNFGSLCVFKFTLGHL